MPCKVPGKNSVFWKLACLLVVFCLLMIWLSWSWGRYMDKRTGFLSEQAHGTLVRYAGEAERAWETGQQTGVDQWLQAMGHREPGWVGVIGQDLQSLSSYPLSERESERLTFLRGLDWPISHIKTARPWIKVPFPRDPSMGSLVIELPQRFMPGRSQVVWRIVTNGVIPGLLTLLLCVGLYRVLIVPLNHLREQANAWRADQLGARLSSQTTSRQDELGELARAFDQMSERLQSTVSQQQQLLRDLSHELRTPLSRLRVACDSEQGVDALRERLSREVDGMQRLVEDTLHWPGWTPSAGRCQWKTYRCRRCGKCSPRMPALKVAGRNRGCLAWWMSIAGCAGTSTAWPRRWRTSCAMPSAIRPQTASSASAVSAKAIGGIYGSTIRAVAWHLKSWSGFLRPLPGSTVRDRVMAASAWG